MTAAARSDGRSCTDLCVSDSERFGLRRAVAFEASDAAEDERLDLEDSFESVLFLYIRYITYVHSRLIYNYFLILYLSIVPLYFVRTCLISRRINPHAAPASS